jgi:hypothetical protein
MTSKNAEIAKGFDDLADMLGWSSNTESAEWYLQSNITIPWPNRPHFDTAHPESSHPVLLLDRRIRDDHPPTHTYPCWIRSSTVYSRIKHEKHQHPSKACSLNRTGYIVTESTVPITKEDLLHYFCDEPQTSKLLNQLRQHVDFLVASVGNSK